MSNLIGSSLFTSAISGINSNFLLLLNGNKSLSLKDILNPKDDAVKYTVNQTFRSYLMTNFNQIDTDGDGKITSKDIDKYVTKIQTQGMTYAELSQLSSTGTSSMSSLLDTVLSNFDTIDANHDGRVTQSEINAYRINKEIKQVKEDYPTIDPTRMSLFYESQAAEKTSKSTDNNDKVFNS